MTNHPESHWNQPLRADSAETSPAMAVMAEPPPFRFVVDRPFFLEIRERPTGLILFPGAIADPR
jgi:serine protease inhibitor